MYLVFSVRKRKNGAHDIAAALRYASHILHIGAEVFFGTKEDYLRSDVGKLFLTQQKGGEA